MMIKNNNNNSSKNSGKNETFQPEQVDARLATKCKQKLETKKKRQQKNTASSVENCPIFIPDF